MYVQKLHFVAQQLRSIGELMLFLLTQECKKIIFLIILHVLLFCFYGIFVFCFVFFIFLLQNVYVVVLTEFRVRFVIDFYLEVYIRENLSVECFFKRCKLRFETSISNCRKAGLR